MPSSLELLRFNLLSPMLLAFILGIIAVRVNSDLKIPQQAYDIISIYLLFSIGLKGGFDLAKSSLAAFTLPAIAGIGLGVLIPVVAFIILRTMGRFDSTNAAAIAMHYGGVSAVTLSTVLTVLEKANIPAEGFMPTLYTLFDLGAIISALWLASRTAALQQSAWSTIRSALTSKGFVLLGGGTLIGFISGDNGYALVSPVFITAFAGVLTLFLLEMGTVVGAKLEDLRTVGGFLVVFAILMPIFNGLLGIVVGYWIGLSMGGAVVLGTLAASASYITAPAVVKQQLPEANAGFSLTASLVITFPFNLIVGIPLYLQIARWVYGV